MKVFLSICLSALFASSALAYFILFDGNLAKLNNWWQEVARNSESLPLAPYKNRVIAKSNLRIEHANEVKIFDRHLFWKGTGAKIEPILDRKNNLKYLNIVNGGYGYSSSVDIRITGAGSHHFKIGNVKVLNGVIKSVKVIESSKWNDQPLAYAFDEIYPFSGVVKNEFPGGQIIEQIPYLSGKIHGTIKRWNEYGLPLSNKDYLHGNKHGTHIYWFEFTNDPQDFVPFKSINGEIYPTLWIKLQEEAKKKFRSKFGSHEANEWITFNYRRQGGDFPVRLLEHWKDNLRHGLFEGFDNLGNKTFKDDYQMGHRIKHKTFDKTK
jgi:hypothetical protein